MGQLLFLIIDYANYGNTTEEISYVAQQKGNVLYQVWKEHDTLEDTDSGVLKNEKVAL